MPKIFERIPEAKKAVVNIIDSCVDQIANDNIKQIYLLGSEGTIESEVYQKALAQKGIKCQVPEKEQYVLLRECIEAVKQNKYTDEVESIFEKLVGEYEMPVILGCTELPMQLKKFHQHQIEVDSLGSGNLSSIQPALRHLIDFLTVQHQVGCESVMLIKKDVLILNGQKLVQSMQVHKKLMLQIMSERITAHHLLCLFVQLAIDKD